MRDLAAELITPRWASVNNQMRDVANRWQLARVVPGTDEPEFKGAHQHPGRMLLEMFLRQDQLNAHLCSIPIDRSLPFGSEGGSDLLLLMTAESG